MPRSASWKPFEGSTMRSMKLNSAFGVREIANSTLVSNGWSMLSRVHFPLCFSAFTPSHHFPSHLLLLQRPSPILMKLRRPR
jgi:hypothetical protein